MFLLKHKLLLNAVYHENSRGATIGVVTVKIMYIDKASVCLKLL